MGSTWPNSSPAASKKRAQLTSVTNEMYNELKTRLTRNLNEQEKQAKDTNAPPTVLEKQK